MKKSANLQKPILYLLPAILILAVVVLYPVLNALYVSFFQWDLATGNKMFFIGWQNYRETLGDVYYWSAIGRSLMFVLMVVPTELLLGTLIAILLNNDIKGRRILRVLFILPMMITPVVVTILWKIIYNNQFGILNWILSLVGISPQVWLGNPQLAMFSVALVDIWQNTPFIILLVLAGLQVIPGDVYQAAEIDGADGWQSFRFVTLPYLSGTLFLGAIFRVVDSFRVFDIIYVLTKGGPGRVTEVISLYTYKTGFSLFKFGLSASQSMLLMLLTLIVAIPLIIGLLSNISSRKGVA